MDQKLPPIHPGEVLLEGFLKPLNVSQSRLALPDSSIVLMGGYDGSYRKDVWRSTDQGATWTLMTASVPNSDHSSVTLPDGSIVLNLSMKLNVWRMETADSTDQHPTHIYTELGSYSVALQVYNPDGFSNFIKEAYINVTNTGTYWLYLPLALRNTP